MSLVKSGLNMNPVDTAKAVGWSQSTVKIIQSRYLREGEKALLGKGRGGKRYSNLTINQEKELLDSFLEKAKSGGVLVVSEIKIAYEKLLTRRCPNPLFTGCWLDMAGVRSPLVPKHSRTDLAAQEEFKKPLPSSKKK